MLPRERQMFEVWLFGIGQTFDGFMFDVRVGQGRAITLSDIRDLERRIGVSFMLSEEELTKIDASVRLAWQSLTQKRIDAIGFRGTETWLIEVKKTLNMSLIGQLDIYSILLLRDYPPEGPFFRAAIVGDVDPDVGPIAQERGIMIFRVPVLV
jgi:hypothetical protein